MDGATEAHGDQVAVQDWHLMWNAVCTTPALPSISLSLHPTYFPFWKMGASKGLGAEQTSSTRWPSGLSRPKLAMAPVVTESPHWWRGQ